MSEKPVNMMEALGIVNQAHGPTKAPPEMAMQVMQLAAKYLLYERAEETALTMAFIQLVEERHAHFHAKHKYREEGPNKGKPLPWSLCDNMTCKQAREIIANVRKQEINISGLAANLMHEYTINFLPSPNNLRLWIAKRSEMQLTATEAEKQAAGRILLTDN